MNLSTVVLSVLMGSTMVGLASCASMANMNSFERKAAVCGTTVALGAGLGALLSKKKREQKGLQLVLEQAPGLACYLLRSIPTIKSEFDQYKREP